jgi:hypothetical protein
MKEAASKGCFFVFEGIDAFIFRYSGRYANVSEKKFSSETVSTVMERVILLTFCF